MTELRELLDRATDRIEAPHLAEQAWARSGRVRAARRSAAGAAAAVVVVAAVLMATRAPDSKVPPQPSPLPSAGVTTPPTDEVATQDVWDPFDLINAPARASRLPERVSPPAAPPDLETTSGVVLAWPQEDADLRLLDEEGRWWTVPGTATAVRWSLNDVVRPAISSDGTQVAMATVDGIRVVDVTTGEDRTLPWPGPLGPPWDSAPTVLWQAGDDGFVVLDWRGVWTVDTDGAGSRAPYPGRYVSLAADPRGGVYQNDYDRRMLLTWQGDEVVREAPLYQCERLVAGYGMVACTTGSLEPARSGPIVVDPITGEVVAYAPIKDGSSVYSDNGHLTTMGFPDPDTVLLLVGPADFRTDEPEVERWHLVAWEFRAGTFEVLSTGGADMRAIAVAPGLVD
jgi:hypothetical protein